MAKADDWVEVSSSVHVLRGAVNCALIETPDGGAVLVDSGADKDHGKRMRRRLEALGRVPSALICSHSHADHIGGNAYLQTVYPEMITYAPEIEAELIRAPYLEPVYLFNGAMPLPELIDKWLQAPASRVDSVVGPGTVELGGLAFELIDVRGHAHRQLAVLVNGVLLAADALFGAATLERYPIPFVQDVGGQLRSIDVAAGTSASTLVPGHGDPTTDAQALAVTNRAVVERALSAVESACSGVGTEVVLAGACAELGIEMTDLKRYYLNSCAVHAHLGYLRSEGRVRLELWRGAPKWSRA